MDRRFCIGVWLSRALCRVVNPALYTGEVYQHELKKEDSFVSRVHRGERLDLLFRSEIVRG